MCTSVVAGRRVFAQVQTGPVHPKREFRAAWIQAVNGQFRGVPTDKLKQTLISQLNSLQGAGINAIIFQVRPEGDVLYASRLSRGAVSSLGCKAKLPNRIGILCSCIEMPARGMEFHAWINPYRTKTTLKESSWPPTMYIISTRSGS